MGFNGIYIYTHIIYIHDGEQWRYSYTMGYIYIQIDMIFGFDSKLEVNILC